MDATQAFQAQAA